METKDALLARLKAERAKCPHTVVDVAPGIDKEWRLVCEGCWAVLSEHDSLREVDKAIEERKRQ